MAKRSLDKTSYLSICTGKEGAFEITDKVILYTPPVEDTISLFISETDTDVLVTPQEDADIEEMFSGMAAMTKKTAKFVFAKEELLNIVGEKAERIIDVVALVGNLSTIESAKLVGLINTLKERGKEPNVTLKTLNSMSENQVKKLVSVAEEMPSLLAETYSKMITKY